MAFIRGKYVKNKDFNIYLCVMMLVPLQVVAF